MKKILSAVLITILILQSFIFAVSAEETRLWLTLDSVDLKTGSLSLVTENGSFIIADNTSTQELSPGESAWVTINENNDITAIEKIPYYDLELGYMSQIVSGTYSSGAEYLRITVFKDKKLTFDLSSEIMLNGEKANASGTYSVLSAFEGAVAYKYDSEINKITEIYTLETPAQSLSEAVFNPETGSFDELNYPVTADTITLFVDGKGGLSSVNFEDDCLYGLSVYGYDKDYNAKLVVVDEISYSDVLFYKGEITAKSGDKYYLNAYDTENIKKNILISDSCALNGEEFSDIPALYEALGSFEGLIEISSDVKGNINKINTLTSGVAFKNIEYNANANIIGEYNLYETKYFMVKDIFKSGENTFNTVHKWNNMDELSENYTYSGTFYDTASGKYLWINDKTPVSGYLPSTDYGIRYNKEAKIFTAFVNVSKNDYADDATIVVCAYENDKLIDSDYISTAQLGENKKYLSAACTLSEGKSLSDYKFKYFMFDKALKTLENYPVFTGEEAYETDEKDAVYVSGVVVSNGIVSIESGSGTNVNPSSAPQIKVNLTNTYNSVHPEFEEFSGCTEEEMEAMNTRRTFLTADSNADEYVGRKVNLWLAENEDGMLYVLSCELDSSNKIAEFTLDRFCSLSAGSKYKIEYYEGEDYTKTALPLQNGENTVVVYNNYNLGEDRISDIFDWHLYENNPFSGKVTLIDNDTTSGYDVVFVELGATGVVDEVEDGRILFKEEVIITNADGYEDFLSKLVVDEDDYRTVKILKNNKEISASELCEWDVLSITAESANADYIVCEVVDNIITGTVSGISYSPTSDSFNNNAYKIGNKVYDVSYCAYNAHRLETGDTGSFYIDKYGKIIAFKEYEAPNAQYGFVLNAVMDTAGVTDGVFQVKMLTADGEKTYYFAETVSYYYAHNGGYRETVKSESIAPATFLATNQSHLIKFATNTKGEISTVYEADYDYEKFETFYDTSDMYAQTWNAENLSFDSIAVDEDATVLFLATNYGGSWGDITINGSYYDIDASSSYFGTVSDLEDGGMYNYIAYRTASGDDANLLVITTGLNNVSVSSNIAVITDVSQERDKNGDDIYVLSYYKDGELYENIKTTNSVYYEMDFLSTGDIVKLKETNGIVTAVLDLVNFEREIRYKDGGMAANYCSTSGIDERFDFGYAERYNKDTNTVIINEEFHNLSEAENIYVIDPKKRVNKVYKGTLDDYIYTETEDDYFKEFGEYLFVRSYDGTVKDVVIVKSIFDDVEYELTMMEYDDAYYCGETDRATNLAIKLYKMAQERNDEDLAKEAKELLMDAAAIDGNEVFEASGIVTETAATSVSELRSYDYDKEVLTGVLTDGETVYLEGAEEAEKLLGKAVNIIYKENADGIKTIVYAEVNKNIHREETISISAYNGFDDGMIDENAFVVYNGQGGYKVSDIFDIYIKTGNRLSGEITLIENNGTDGYDVIFINEAKPAVINYINRDADAVYFKENVKPMLGGTVNNLTFSDAEPVIRLYKDGEEIGFNELTEYDVLSLCTASASHGYIKCEVITNIAEGTIEEMSVDGKTLTVNGKTYNISDSTYMKDKLQKGVSGTFYIDSYNSIAAYSPEPPVKQMYGYLLAAESSASSINPIVQIKVIEDDGAKIYTLAEQVKFFTNSGELKTLKSNKEELINELINNINGVIEYSVSPDGKIFEVKAPTDADIYSDFMISRYNATGVWNVERKTLGDCEISPDTKIFCLATTVNADGNLDINGVLYKIDEDSSFVGTHSDLDDGDVYDYISYVDENDEVIAIVLTRGFMGIGTTTNIAVIENVEYGRDDNNNDIFILDYYQDGERVSAAETSKSVYKSNLDNLTAGDIVKLKKRSTGEIINLEILVDFDSSIRNDDGTMTATHMSFTGSAVEEYAFGYAENYTNAKKTVMLDGISYRLSKAENVYVIDPSTRTLDIGTGSAGDYEFNPDIQRLEKYYADYIFLRRYDGEIKDLVIIKSLFADPEDDPNYDYNVEMSEKAFEAECELMDAEWWYNDEYSNYQNAYNEYQHRLYEYQANPNDFYYRDVLNEAIDYLKETVISYKEAADNYLEKAENYSEFDSDYSLDDAQKAKFTAESDYTFANSLQHITDNSYTGGSSSGGSGGSGSSGGGYGGDTGEGGTSDGTVTGIPEAIVEGTVE